MQNLRRAIAVVYAGFLSLGVACGSRDASDAQPGIPDDVLVFTDPIFFQAPTNTLRYVTSGHDSGLGLCVSAVWWIGSFDDPQVHCDDFYDHSGYIVIVPADDVGCFDYEGNATVRRAEGCVDWAEYRPGHSDFADLAFDVESSEWSGTIIFDYAPWPSLRAHAEISHVMSF